MNPVIVSCGWDKVVKVGVPNERLAHDVILYICYFRELFAL